MHRGSRGLRTLLGLAFCAVILIGLTGCGSEVPIVSTIRNTNDQTLKQQQEWAVLHIEQVIATTDTSTKWKEDSDAEPRWEPDQQKILDEAERSRCAFRAGRVNPAQLLVMVWAEGLGEGVFAKAERVRARWESEGWSVSDVIRREDTVAGNEIEFRADRADGSMLALSAVRGVRGGILSLTVQAACSSHPSVAW